MVSSATTSLSPYYNGSENSNTHINHDQECRGVLDAGAFKASITVDSNTTALLRFRGLASGNTTTIKVPDEKVSRTSGEKVPIKVELSTQRTWSRSGMRLNKCIQLECNGRVRRSLARAKVLRWI